MDPNQQPQPITQPIENTQQAPLTQVPLGNMPQNTNPIPLKKSFFSRKIIITLLLIVILFASCAGGYFYFIYWPAKLDKEYTQSNVKILPKLADEINRLKNEDFLAAKNIKLDYEDAKKALLQHQTNTNNTKVKVASLKDNYNILKPTPRTKKLDELSTNQFKIAEDIVKDYGDSLVYRQKIFDAYGDKLYPALDIFASAHYSGGERANFIIQAQKISDITTQINYALKNIIPQDDDKADYDYRVKYINDINSTFDKLSADYRLGKDEEAGVELGNMSARLDSYAKDFEKVIDDFVTKSNTALNFEKFEENIKAINDLLAKYKK